MVCGAFHGVNKVMCACRDQATTPVPSFRGEKGGVCLSQPGNNPWPIGVTSVGIHERSAREKISHVMNGGAHIMNDEATRKYLQACYHMIIRLC